jgi:thiosulfate/3-mercaptopyruvate sulfurtransferase
MSRSQALVTADWLEEHIDDPHVSIIEVDEDTTLYEKSHIKNAITFHWRNDLQDGLIRDLISKQKFEALLSKNGIANDTTVVLYGGNNNWFATYAYWYFKIYGHADVRLLDGGRKKWELEGRALTTDVPAITPTRYVAKERDLTIRAFRDEVISSIGAKNIVDVRSPAEYKGELLAPAHLPQEGGQVAGPVSYTHLRAHET